jgi:hypothetical protein
MGKGLGERKEGKSRRWVGRGWRKKKKLTIEGQGV